MTTVAIPVKDDKGPESSVDHHFSRAPYYALYDIEKESFTIIKNEAANKPGHEGPLELLDARDVTAVLCAGIGPGALDFAAELGMTVCFGRAQTASDMVEMYEARELENVSDGSPCGRD